ncbi:MAG: hypothetical protein IJQ35_00395 [Bacteroidales bacterium]|nr:hypothetical protein [Bacteroidales bacterium]
MTRKVLLIAAALATMAVCSCTKEPAQEPLPEGFGGITLRLDSGSALRLETKGEDLADSPQFNNVLVILENSSHKVAGIVYKAFPYVPGTGDIQDAVDASSVTEDIIHFDHLLPGTYNIYAYANIDASVWQDGSALISAQKKVLSVGDDFSSFADRELSSLTAAGSDVPGAPSAYMLLTGRASGVPIGLNVVDAFIDLLRPVVRFKVTVRNHTHFPVTVEDLSFSHFNPDKAYLIDHRDASGVPAVPDGVTYRELPPYPILAGSPKTVAAESEAVVYQTLVYENASPNNYKIFSTMSLDRSSESLSPLEVSLGGRDFGLIDYTTLSGMSDGESVDVLVINPRSATRSGRLYYGIGDSGLSWESCGYDSYNKFFARAQAIYNEDSSHSYVDFIYTGAANNKSGLAGWTGNSDDSYLTSDTGNTGSGITFHYTGARSAYFRTITMHGNLYTIDGLSIDGSGATSISGVRIQQGTKTSGNRFAADIQDSQLVNIVNDATGQHLKSDCQYNESNPDKAKKSRLIWENAGSSTQDHQFMLFGKYCAGGLLKRMLKDNNKEVPLTYMSRNEDINVVLNVYYSDQEGEITFKVDNSTWDDAGATTSEHTFN